MMFQKAMLILIDPQAIRSGSWRLLHQGIDQLLRTRGIAQEPNPVLSATLCVLKRCGPT